jgi:hypothetical protein
MHIRKATCKGAWYHTDRSAVAHDQHLFLPDEWSGPSLCFGWSSSAVSSTQLVEYLDRYLSEYPASDVVRLEVSVSTYRGLNELVEPSLVEVTTKPDALFGIPIRVERLPEDEWQLVTATGIVTRLEALHE